MSLAGFTVPITFDGITLLALVLACLAVVAIVSAIVDLARERRLRPFRFGGGFILLLLGLVAFGFAGWAQTYRSLTHNELVAYIQAAPIQGQSQTMSVTYTPVHDGQNGTPLTYLIKGDEWQLGGDVIKWQDYMNILGVHTGYRITRLMGYYDNAADYKTKRVTAEDLDGGSDDVYRFLQDHANLAPFVRATYGNAVIQRPDPTHTYKVYLSTSGYWTATS